ncbi:MAG: CRISPR-associated protein Cas4 [Fimbriimonadia bacterium]
MRGWQEDEVVLVSAIEHYSYCPRQYALIHIESTFDENLFTLRGRFTHERVDDPHARYEHDVRVERAVPIWSDQYGLIGKADVVEFDGDGVPFPVEYKSGRPRGHIHEFAQLCAQSLCLEEMLGVAVPRGAVYYAATRRRVERDLDQQLRRATLKIVEAIRVAQRTLEVPPAVYDPRCRNCSLQDACLPELIGTTIRFDDLFLPRAERELP